MKLILEQRPNKLYGIRKLARDYMLDRREIAGRPIRIQAVDREQTDRCENQQHGHSDS